MKSFVKKSFASLLLLGAAGALFACSGEDTASSDSSTEVANEQDFVAVTASEWDAEVTVGSHIYTFDLALKADSTLSFEATCVGESQSMGGGGFPGFGSVIVSSSSEAVDYSSYDFSFGGSWTLETGYGYILSFEDDAKSTIHVDYNKTQGRHEFYYSVTTSEGSTTTLFQARDSAFRSTLADDYATWDERDSTYIFTGETTGNNNSLAYAYLYCHSDGSAVFNTASGSDREVTLGLSWSVTDGVFSLVDGDSTYTADTSINTSRPGYRLNYQDIAFFCSTSSSVAWDDMENGDFDGETLYKFEGSLTTSGMNVTTYFIELDLAVDNRAFLYIGSTQNTTGTYTFENEVFHIELAGHDATDVSKNDDGSYTYTFVYSVSSGWGGATDYDVSLTYTPGE